MTGSLVIICVFVCQKSAAIALLGIGFSVTAWLLQYLWQNVQDLFIHYSFYVAIYFIVAGVSSFAVCYYKGPVTNPRLLDLIRWSIQLLAIAVIYYSSQIVEVSATIIALVLMISIIPRRFYMVGVPSFIMAYWYVWYPVMLGLTRQILVVFSETSDCVWTKTVFAETNWNWF